MEEPRNEKEPVEAKAREPKPSDQPANYLEEITSGARAFMEAVGPALDAARKFIEENKEGLEAMSRFGEVYKKELEKFDATHKQALKILNQYGWFLTPSSLPVLLIFPIVKIGSADGDQSQPINELFVAHFTSNDFEHLEELVERWAGNPIFDSRMHIFKACIASLRKASDGYNPSNVVIPPLISQIDGIQTEYMVTWGSSYDEKAKIWRDKSDRSSRLSRLG